MGTLNEAKYRNAILYFATHINNGTLGRLKLMKLLYYLDFDHYEQYGQSVTGDEYRHMPKGPWPVSAMVVLERMQREAILSVYQRNIGYEHPMDEYVPERQYDITVFAPSEVEILASVAGKWLLHTGTNLMAATHGEPPWLETPPGAIIDYRLALLRTSREVETGEEDEEADKVLEMSAKEHTARTKGLALVRQMEQFEAEHPEFAVALHAAEQDIDEGRFMRFDNEGWQE